MERVTANGIVESLQRTDTPTPPLPRSVVGAGALGALYWDEVRRSTGGLVRLRATSDGLDLCLLGHGPPALRLGAAEVTVVDGTVACRHRILGGLLARRPGGLIEVAQEQDGVARVHLTGFAPRLTARPTAPRAARLPYTLQARAHVAVSCRFFRRLRSASA